MDNKADRSSSHSILRSRLGSGIDNRRRFGYMADSQITIFYSWQSDLPGSDTSATGNK